MIGLDCVVVSGGVVMVVMVMSRDSIRFIMGCSGGKGIGIFCV